MIQARAPSIKSLPPRALAAEAQMARLFAGRSLRLSMEDAFRLPRGERSDPLLLNLVGRLQLCLTEYSRRYPQGRGR